jgi:hypothetical protein
MHDRAEKAMKSNIQLAVGGESKFKDQYCKEPLLKESGSYYNKTKSSWSRITAVPGPHKWVEGKKVFTTYKLSDLSVSMLKGDALARMKSITKDSCPRELTAAEKALKVPKADGSGSWKIGDKVQCRWKGRRRTFPGTIAGIKGTKIFIKYDDGDTEWTTADMVSPR